MRLKIYFVISLVIIFGTYLIGIHAFHKFRQLSAAADVYQTYQTQLRSLQGEITAIQSAVQGYVLSRDPRDVERFNRSLADTESLLTSILSDSSKPFSNAEIEKIAQTVKNTIEAQKEVLILAKSGHRGTSVQLIESGKSRESLDRVISEIRTAVARIGTNLSVSLRDARQTGRTSVRIFSISTVIAVLVLGAFFFLFSREVDSRRQAQTRAELATRAKSEFLAHMSHEIRTPMTGVLGMTGILMKTEMNQDQIQLVSAIQSSAEGLLTVINEVLDLSQIEAGKMELRPSKFDLFAMLNTVHGMFQTAAQDKDLELRLELAGPSDQLFMGDEGRLKQVLINLVGNAIKFTDRGGVTIFVNVTQKAGEAQVDFDVEDTGIGISKENISKLFHSFSQIERSNSRRYGGTGLGLRISQSIVGMMGGRIEVLSTLGQGSRFSFSVTLRTLPKTSSIPAVAALPESESDLSGVHILCVEDNTTIQMLLKRIFKQSHCKIEVVDDGHKALEIFKAQHFDLVLMDCQLPSIDGFTTTKQIRQTPKGREIPIIALTANATPEERQKCMDSGMDDFISKPFEVNQLMTTIQRHLKRGRNPISKEAFVRLESLESGEPGFLLDLIKTFKTNSQVQIGEIDRFLSVDDFGSAARSAHSLKSASGALGAKYLSDLCEEFEVTCARQNDKSGQAKFSELKSELGRLNSQLDEYLESRSRKIA